jgi:hypothetical protein
MHISDAYGFLAGKPKICIWNSWLVP